MMVVRRGNPQNLYTTRTGAAVLQRYRKARCECLKFEALIATIQAKRPTGSQSEADIERAALAVYNGDGTIGDMYTYITDKPVSVGPDFPFKDSLWYLRQTDTWNMVLASQQVRTQTSPSHVQSPIDCQGDRIDADNNERSSVDSGQDSKDNGTTSADRSGSLPRRPVGTKRALEMSKHIAVLHKGAQGIEMLAEAAVKRTKLAEEMLNIDRSMVALFSMPGTDPAIQKRFTEISQLKALASLEKVISAVHNDTFSPGAASTPRVQTADAELARASPNRNTVSSRLVVEIVEEVCVPSFPPSGLDAILN